MMSESKSTPGPWVAQDGTTTGREVIAPNAPKSKRVIARCGGPDRDGNAKLIAAASDLYEALRPFAEFLDAFEKLGGPSGFHDGVVYAVTSHAVGERELTGLDFKRAREAIAKARP